MLNKMVALAIGAGGLVIVAIGATAQVQQAKSLKPDTTLTPQLPASSLAEPKPSITSFPLFTEGSRNLVKVAPQPELQLPSLPIPDPDIKLEFFTEAEIIQNHDQLMQGVVPPREIQGDFSQSSVPPASPRVSTRNDDLPYPVSPQAPRVSTDRQIAPQSDHPLQISPPPLVSSELLPENPATYLPHEAPFPILEEQTFQPQLFLEDRHSTPTED